MAQRGRFLAPDIGRHLLREEDEVVVDEVTHHWVAYLPGAAYGLVGLALVLWLPVIDADIGWLADLQARRHSRAFARRHGGRAGERAMREYQQAAVELGFLHHRYLRGTAPADAAARGHAHLTRIQAVRPLIAFPGPAVPAGR